MSYLGRRKGVSSWDTPQRALLLVRRPVGPSPLKDVDPFLIPPNLMSFTISIFYLLFMLIISRK